MESGAALAQERQIAFATDDYDALLARKDIDVMDICVPPALHHEFAIRAADAGKHIIMEKPLTGYFGAAGDPEPIGFHVPRTRMRQGACNNAEAVRAAVHRNHVQFCYAENWIYEHCCVWGVHSVGALLHLKQWEGHLRFGKSVQPVSVFRGHRGPDPQPSFGAS